MRIKRFVQKGLGVHEQLLDTCSQKDGHTIVGQHALHHEHQSLSEPRVIHQHPRKISHKSESQTQKTNLENCVRTDTWPQRKVYARRRFCGRRVLVFQCATGRLGSRAKWHRNPKWDRRAQCQSQWQRPQYVPGTPQTGRCEGVVRKEGPGPRSGSPGWKRAPFASRTWEEFGNKDANVAPGITWHY